MAKLSKDTREDMARALVERRFAGRAGELCAESATLFKAVFDERYNPATQKLMRQLQARQPGAFKKTNSIYLRARGMRVPVGGNAIGHFNIVRWTPEVAERAILYNESDEPSEALAERIAEFALATKHFVEEIQQAYSRALGAIGQFATAKRLAEEWPEAMPVIGHLLTVENRALPVVQMEAINDEFGLPPAELEAA